MTFGLVIRAIESHAYRIKIQYAEFIFSSRMNFMKKLITATLISMGFAATASAATHTLNLHWSGSSFGNNATASGVISFDDSIVEQSTNNAVFGISDLKVTISDANSGNGTFTLSDIGAVTFYSPSSLNFSTQLIGQQLSNGCTFGTSTGACGDGSSGDFNLFGHSSTAPTGTWYFELTTSAGAGNQMLLTSMAPVPEPETLAMFLVGLGLMSAVTCRRRQKLEPSS